MSDDIEKIDEIFRIHDDMDGKSAEIRSNVDNEISYAVEEPTARIVKGYSGQMKAAGNSTHKSDDVKPQKSQPPKRIKKENAAMKPEKVYKTGCLGGLMYFVFIMCISVVLACVAWMAASDMLALNKETFSAVVTLPTEIFNSETVDTYDEDGNLNGNKRVTHADISYVSSALKEANLIEYKWLFELFCKVSNADEKVDPGEYELHSSYDYRALIKHMQSGAGSTVTVDVTIPEGFTMRQIFLRLEENGVCSYDKLMEAAASYKYNYSFLEAGENQGAERLEGYLFPDTYQFYVGMQASSAINKLLETFYYKYDADLISQTQNQGRSIKDVVTVASLIEKEAANDSERPVIASVIYNRLNSGMVLGIDASILYAYPDHEGAPTAEMIAADNVYNTRMYAGLTPTPICNPGLASVKAALEPASTDYLYYALDTATGEHKFFNNVNDFNAFVATQNYG